MIDLKSLIRYNYGMDEITVLANAVWQDFVWIGISLGLLLAGGGAAYAMVRKQLRRGDAAGDGDAEAFTLEQLRRLHREGRISDGEFEVLKNQIIRNVKM